MLIHVGLFKEVNPMPNIKSAEKRVKVSAARRERNMSDRSTLKTVIKKMDQTIANDPNSAADLLPVTMKVLDEAVTKGLIHKNKAARKKSRMAKKIATQA